VPATQQEIERAAATIMAGEVMPDTDWIWNDGTRSTPEEHDLLTRTMRLFFPISRRKQRIAQTKAMNLLTGFLTMRQREQVSQCGYFYVTGSNGGRYRIYARTAITERVERHGKNHYLTGSYCLHANEKLPPADCALAHLLLLRTDEARFLRLANYSPHTNAQLWNGQHMRMCAIYRRDFNSRRPVGYRETITVPYPTYEEAEAI
jgi:hypothetical protein